MLAKGAFAMAAAALALSVWTTLKTPEETLPVSDMAAVATETDGVAEPAPVTQPVVASSAAADAQVVAFEAIKSRVTALEQHQSAAAASRSAEPRTIAVSIDEQPTQYVSLNSPEQSVVVQQDPSGMLYAINTDPSLAGNVIEIEAIRADGGVETLTVTVPQPGTWGVL